MATSGSVSTNAAQEGRYYTVSWSASQSVTNNQSTISWVLSCAGGVAWYAERTLRVVVAGSTVVDKTARVERYAGNIASGTVTVNHDANGNASFSISIQAAVYTSSVNCTGSGSFALDTIPRKSDITSLTNGTLGTAQTIGVTRKSSSFTHTLSYWSGNASGTICTKSTAPWISFTPPLSLASQNTTGTSLTVGIRIETFNGNTSIGYSNYYITCAIPASVKPSCSLSLSDATGKASTYGGYIRGVSKVAVTVNTTTSYGSAIASYSTSVDGSTYSGASFTTGVLKSSGTVAVSATVKDKRGRSGSASSNITVLDYSFPAITLLKVQRCNSDGTNNDKGEYAKVTFSYNVTSLSNKNHCTCSIKYKKSSESSYTTVEQTSLANNFSVSEATYIFAADSGSSYNVGLSVTDDFGTSSSATSVSTASVIMHWLASGLGMAIGKVAEIENAFEVGWNAIFNKPVQFRSTSYHAKWGWSNTSTSVFFKIAKITIKEPYINFPIVLEFSTQTSGYPVTVAITFESGNTADPGLYGFNYFGDTSRKFYIVKTATSEWSLYCNSKSPYDGVLLDRYHFRYDIQNEKYIEMEFIDEEPVSSLPSGYTEASYLSIDAATLSGIGIRNTDGYGKAWPYIPVVKSDGVMEIGRYIDWHYNSGDSGDYTARMWLNANGQISFSHGIENVKCDLIYNGGTNGPIYFTPGNYDLLIVCGWPTDGAAPGAAHSVVVVPAKWYNDSFQFSDETGWYKFTLYGNGISGRASGYGTIRRVYGVRLT